MITDDSQATEDKVTKAIEENNKKEHLESTSFTSTPPASLSPSSSKVLADQIRSSNWKGCVPILLTLAPTSLSSTTVPSPIHVLVSRHTFLHVGLEDAVRRLQDYGPPSFAFKKVMQVQESDHYLESNSSEEDTDRKKDDDGDKGATKQSNGDTGSSASDNKLPPVYPVCWFVDEATQQPLKWQYFVGVLFDSTHPHTKGNGNESSLPWKIQLHFNSYPSHTLLELDSGTPVLTTVERTFKNSLKQALVLLHGNNKVALNLSKQSHQSLWKAIQNSSYDLYKPISLQELQPKENVDVKMIPIRLWLDPTTPMIQRRWDNVGPGVDSSQTLGELLCQWVPQYFEKGSADDTFCPTNKTISWRVAGVKPPLSSCLIDLWRALSQPDNFLYICVKGMN
jgi:hypothetical protein